MKRGYKRYKNLYIPHLLENNRAEYIRAILHKVNLCRVGVNCSELSCAICVFEEFEEANYYPPIEWFIGEGYFTKVEVLDISLT